MARSRSFGGVVLSALAVGLAVFSLLAIYPFALYPLSLLLIPRVREESQASPWIRPPIAVCMSAYNEEKVIVEKVESLLAMARAYGPAEVLVFVDGAEDCTAELLQPYADRIRLTVSSGRNGKTAGLNHLVGQTDAPLLVFTDANVRCPIDALIRLAHHFRDPSIGCVSASLDYDVDDEVAGVGAAYWSVEEAIKRRESDTIGLVGVDGALFAIDRSLYEPPPNHLIDDLYVSLLALASGRRVISDRLLRVRERGAARWAEELTRKRRIACQAWRVHAALWPRLRRLPAPRLYGYCVHRVLKWLSPFAVALALDCALGLLAAKAGWPMAIGLLTGVALLWAGGARLGVPLCRSLGAVAVSFVGVGLGGIDALLTDRTYTVWTPAASVRDIEPAGEGGSGEAETMRRVAPRAGLEPATSRLTADCSTN